VLEGLFQPCVASLSYFERQAQLCSGALGRGAKLAGRFLCEPDDPLIVAEVVVA